MLESSITFIVLASFTIVTYDRQNMFIIQATGLMYIKKISQKCLRQPETVTVALLSLGEVRHEELILICVEYPQVTKASKATIAVSGIFAKKVSCT